MGTPRHPSALLAFDAAGEATAILEKDNLFLSVESLTHHFDEARRKESSHELLPLSFFGVNHFNGRELHILVTLGELHVTVASFSCLMVHLEAGRGGAEQCLCTTHVGEHQGGIAGMVAWGWLLLLVALLVFFIDDDESEVLEGEQDAGTNAKNKPIRLGGGLPLIDIQPLCIGEFGVIDPHAVAEDVVETFRNLGSEGNFGKEVKHLLPFTQIVVDEVDVDFCFARRGYAVEEDCAFRLESSFNFGKGGLLGRGEGANSDIVAA